MLRIETLQVWVRFLTQVTIISNHDATNSPANQRHCQIRHDRWYAVEMSRLITKWQTRKKWLASRLTYTLSEKSGIRRLLMTRSTMGYCWFACDVAATTLVVKNKSISLLWELISGFMKILREKIILYWPPIWPPCHVVVNQECWGRRNSPRSIN